MNNEYIKNADFERIFELAKPFLEKAGRLYEEPETLPQTKNRGLRQANNNSGFGTLGFMSVNQLFNYELPDSDSILTDMTKTTKKARKLVELYKPQMKSVDEIVPLTDLFFADFPELTDAEREVMAGETVPTVLTAFKEKLEAMSDADFVTENIFPQIKAVQKETGIKGKNLFMPIRIAVSGEMHGPELPDTIYLLGREKSIQHIENMLNQIQ